MSTQIRQKQILNNTITGADLNPNLGIFDETHIYTEFEQVLWKGSIYKVKAGQTVPIKDEGDLTLAPDINTLQWNKLNITNITTVGIGGDYPTIGSAIINNKDNLLLISDITETNTFTFPLTNLKVDFNGFEMFMDIYSMNVDTSGLTNITFYNAKIKFGNTTSGTVLNIMTHSPFYAKLNFIGKTEITSIATLDYIYFINNGEYTRKNIYANFDLLIFNSSNITGGLFTNISTILPIYINKLILIGNGINTNSIIYSGSITTVKSIYIDSIEIKGTFSTNFTSIGGFIINKIIGDSEILIGSARSYYSKPTYINYINCPNAILINCVTVKGESIKAIKGYNNGIKDYITLDNTEIEIKNISEKIIIASNNCLVTNIETSELIVQGDNIDIINCKMLNGTITINATADKTNISNCRTLTSIVDNGTNTILQNNQLI